MVHNILTKEISLILQNYQKQKRVERGIVTSLVTSFIGLAYEGISCYLHNKRQKVLWKAFEAMKNNVNLAITGRLI